MSINIPYEKWENTQESGDTPIQLIPTPKTKPQEKNEVEEFVSQKIDTRNKIIIDHPILSIEEKGDALERVKNFSKIVKENKDLYDKYSTLPNGGKKLIQKIFESSKMPIADINMSFQNWIIILTIPEKNNELFSTDTQSKINMDKYEAFCTPLIKVDDAEYYFIVATKNLPSSKVIDHEIQHFYNEILQEKSDGIKAEICTVLANEAIAQTIYGSFGDSWESFSSLVASGIGKDTMHQSYQFASPYSYGNIYINPDTQKRANLLVLEKLSDAENAWKLRDMEIEHYTDILALTPLEKWWELIDFYSKQNNKDK